MLDSSRLSSSGRGPKSNVSKSGKRSSCSRSCLGAYGWLNLMEFTVCCQPHATRWCTINATKLTVELRTREERRLIRAQLIVTCGLLPHVTAREEVVCSIAVVHGQDGGQKVRVGHDAEGTHWLSPTVRHPCTIAPSYLQRVTLSFRRHQSSLTHRHILRCRRARKQRQAQLRRPLAMASLARRRLQMHCRKTSCSTIRGKMNKRYSY